MKSLIIIGFIFALSLSINAQESKKDNFTNKHEVSFTIDDIFSDRGNVYYSYEYYPYLPYGEYQMYNDDNITRMGLGYKFHFAKSALRTKFTLGKQNKDNVNEIDSFGNERNLVRSEIFLGYEFHKNFKNTQFFYGADIFYNYINTEYVNYNIDAIYGRDIYSESTYTKEGYGVSPFIGVKYFINPMISISTEMKLLIEKYSSKSESMYDNNGTISESKNTATGSNFRMGPVGNLSINFHF